MVSGLECTFLQTLLNMCTWNTWSGDDYCVLSKSVSILKYFRLAPVSFQNLFLVFISFKYGNWNACLSCWISHMYLNLIRVCPFFSCGYIKIQFSMRMVVSFIWMMNISYSSCPFETRWSVFTCHKWHSRFSHLTSDHIVYEDVHLLTFLFALHALVVIQSRLRQEWKYLGSSCFSVTHCCFASQSHTTALLLSHTLLLCFSVTLCCFASQSHIAACNSARKNSINQHPISCTRLETGNWCKSMTGLSPDKVLYSAEFRGMFFPRTDSAH